MPITQEFYISQTVNRQCFTKLCLEYHRLAPDSLRIRPVGLGYIYREIYLRLPLPTPTPSLQITDLTTWEAYPLLAADQTQVIYAAVYDNNIPVSNVELRLTLTMPDGKVVTKIMPLTDQNGQTFVQLESLVAPNGTLVPYQVCIVSVAVSKLCEDERFVLWDSP
jgi:hypothetical protein